MINQATIKAGVEAAKKGIPMAGQKLAEFFSKEGMKQAGQQVSNVGKALYDNRAALASALGDDLTRAGAQVMKAPGAVKAGAQAVGEAASQAAGQVGKEAVRTGIKLGGKAGGQGVKNVGKMMTSPYAVNTGVGIAAEQIAPRLMGGVAPSLKESVVRQGVGQGIGMPVGAGLRAGGVNPTIAAFGGQLAGQLAGAKATQALVTPKYDTFGYTDAETGRDQKLGMIRRDVFESEGLKPGDQFDIKAYGKLEDRYMDNQMSPQQEKQFEDLDRQVFGAGPKSPTGATKHTAEPEFTQVVRPSTTDLSGVQAREALSERDKYEYRLKMAQIEKMPSTVMHMSPDSNNQTLASLAQSMMRQASY